MPTVNIHIDEDVFLPCYRHLLNQEQLFDIEFLYGGRDSGKSRCVAMLYVIACLSLPYFKCLLIRKVLNTVRDSQYSLIKSVIEEWGLQKLFKFRDNRMEIICINGNGFYGRGLDDVGRIKSFNNPSHCWVEEGNQITEEDFTVILTSLRYNGGNVRIFFTFNPECDVNYTEFWLYKDYFAHTQQLSWTWERKIETDKGPFTYRIRATHTTYLDNPYCPPQRAALYESYKYKKNGAYWYQVYTLGRWGFRKSGDAFWKCFDEGEHAEPISLIDSTIHLVVDNNVKPYVSLQFWQIELQLKELRQVHELPCESPNNTATKAATQAAKWLTGIDYRKPVFVYGDPSANARSTTDDEGKSFFAKFNAELRRAGFNVVNRVQKKAPEVAMSGAFINEIYESNLDEWTIVINTTCRKSIEDYTMVKEAADGSMLKKRETDPDTKVNFERYGHFSDCKRYFITTVLHQEYQLYKARHKNIYMYAS